MPIAEIYGGISAFKTMLDMAKALKGMSDTSGRNAAVIELQEKILSAQEAHSALLQHVREIEEEMARMKAWDGEKERYQLKQIADGGFAYALKAGMANGEPAHLLCAHCYQKQKKVLLQQAPMQGMSVFFLCPECKGPVKANSRQVPWA